MVGADGVLPLPWLGGVLRRTLATQRGHALLLHGPQGVGQFELAISLAQAWLCEAGGTEAVVRPCGVCAGCRLVQAHSHPDLLVLVPEAMREATGWGAEGDDAASGERAGKAKPSKEVKVEAVRSAVAFAQSTSARGRVKVVVIHPAERMNAVSANTLLKTLEEPPGNARFILGSSAPDALPATVRSRCQAVALGLPSPTEAAAWLTERGLADPQVLLAATGGQPLEALLWAAEGLAAALWLQVPAAVRRGDAALFSGWALPRLIDVLQKLCHDAAAVAVAAPPRYFPLAALRGCEAAELRSLSDWMRELSRCARHAEHPWNAGLLAESLVLQGARALRAVPGRSAG